MPTVEFSSSFHIQWSFWRWFSSSVCTLVRPWFQPPATWHKVRAYVLFCFLFLAFCSVYPLHHHFKRDSETKQAKGKGSNIKKKRFSCVYLNMPTEARTSDVPVTGGCDTQDVGSSEPKTPGRTASALN